VNLYGVTKLCAEKLLVQGDSYTGDSGPLFSCARYGNVIESGGSVFEVFKQQRENGKITVTDKRMTRFWLTIEQGVRFAIGCIEKMKGGEVFMPKIPSMRIMDLVEGNALGCEIEVIGFRSGEKLHEVLISRDESRHTCELDDAYIVKPVNPCGFSLMGATGNPSRRVFSARVMRMIADCPELHGLMKDF